MGQLVCIRLDQWIAMARRETLARRHLPAEKITQSVRGCAGDVAIAPLIERARRCQRSEALAVDAHALASPCSTRSTASRSGITARSPPSCTYMASAG